VLRSADQEPASRGQADALARTSMHAQGQRPQEFGLRLEYGKAGHGGAPVRASLAVRHCAIAISPYVLAIAQCISIGQFVRHIHKGASSNVRLGS